MTTLGLALLISGAVLVIAETHVPGGILGAAGGVAMIVGGVVVILALGGGLAAAVPVAVGIAIVATAWTMLVTRKAAAAQRWRVRAGAEALSGRLGTVRAWHEPTGQVFVDGALWRARHDDWTDEEAPALNEGDTVVVERVNGLTLSVRRAEDWELIA